MANFVLVMKGRHHGVTILLSKESQQSIIVQPNRHLNFTNSVTVGQNLFISELTKILKVAKNLICIFLKVLFNPFPANDPFLYPLKTSEN